MAFTAQVRSHQRACAKIASLRCGAADDASPMVVLRSLATFALLMAVLLGVSEAADARMGGAAGFGRTGVRIFFWRPGFEQYAVRKVAFEQSSAVRPAQGEGSLGGLFNRPGVVPGLAAGFLGSGLLGVLFGQGLAGGLSGLASVLGLLFQVTLVAMLGRVIWVWWSGHRGVTELTPREQAEPYLRSRTDLLPNDYPAPGDDDERPAKSDGNNMNGKAASLGRVQD